MADDDKTETETAAPAETKPNGTSKPPIENSPRLSRFERYFNRPVAIQFKYPLLQFQFSGDYVDINKERYGSVDVVSQQAANGEIGMQALPFLLGILNASTDGDHLIVWVTMPDGALIEYNLDPESVLSIGFVARLPQGGGRIIQPGLS